MKLDFDAWLPRTLSGRMLLILVAGLLASQLLGMALAFQERAAFMAAGAHRPRGMPLFAGFPARFFWHMSLNIGAVTLFSVLAVRWATQPLQRMASAARAFANDLDAPPLPETGPIEVRGAAEAFNFMQARLRRLVVERGRALAAVSHDLRTPLTRMRLRAELVQDAALRARINADIDAMQGMVDGVLAYLRGIEDSEASQAINMEALLSSIVEDEQALGRQVSLEPAAADRARAAAYVGKLSVLRRAVTNLVDNATTHGTRVNVRLEESGDALRIVVEDDGPGIAPADLARVTEPFVRLDPARSPHTGGAGLGLSIARDAATYHGGTLTLENRSEGGLRAIMTLPRRPPPSPPRR
jgi:signal transduction histidine kinase